MRSRSIVRDLLCLAVLSLVALPAQAALFPVNGQLRIQIGGTGNIGYSIVVSGSGVGVSNGGPGASHTAPAGLFSVTTPLIMPNTGTLTTPGPGNLIVPTVANGAASFAPNGALSLAVMAPWLTFQNLASFAPFPLTPIGGGGTGFGATVALFTLTGATWQGAGAGAPLVFQTTTTYFGTQFVQTATAYDNRTAGGAGTVQLVAPAILDFSFFGRLPAFSTLTLTYVPEPATVTLLLLAAACAWRGSSAGRR